ncbi:MAG: tetratricopeptide repeat protein [Phycisphaerae bacterium]
MKCDSIVLLSLLGTLGAAGLCSADPAEPVTPEVKVRNGQITLPWYTSEPIYKIRPRANGAIWPQNDTKRRDGEKTFGQVVLENEFLAVEILPEAGGVIGGAVYKPTGEDIFFREGKAKNWVPYWESGVKANFPWREHCIRTVGQPAGLRIVRHDDGAVTAAMWMEFSRHDAPWQGAMFGAFTNLLLGQHVTLQPDSSAFTITYRITNPSPYRQGLRLWTDAFFPRNHTADGVVQSDAKPPKPTQTEWIYPAAYVSGHRALNIRPYTNENNLIRKHTDDHNSLFALEMPFGFAGLWYPQVRVNRLRLWDPATASGAKQYYRGEGRFKAGSTSSHMYNFCELWGGIDNVMEGVERWIGPGESYEFSHTYTMVRGIGKVDFANDQAAIHADFGGQDPVLEVVTYRPIESLQARLDGKALGKDQPVGPRSPARFSLPAGAKSGTVELTDAKGNVLLHQKLPLEIPADTSAHERIVAVSDLDSAVGAERIGDQMDYGRTIEHALRKYGKDSLGAGRIHYRKGRLERAAETLEAFTSANEGVGEGWHLLGMTRLEQDKPEQAKAAMQRAVRADQPYPPARYYLAILDIAAENPAAARRQLAALLEANPKHFEAYLLHAWLLADTAPARALAAAEKLAKAAPADPRALRLLAHCARAAEKPDVTTQAESDLQGLMQEPGARRRVDEFLAATRGRFVHPNRLKDFEK